MDHDRKTRGEGEEEQVWIWLDEILSYITNTLTDEIAVTMPFWIASIAKKKAKQSKFKQHEQDGDKIERQANSTFECNNYFLTHPWSSGRNGEIVPLAGMNGMGMNGEMTRYYSIFFNKLLCFLSFVFKLSFHLDSLGLSVCLLFVNPRVEFFDIHRAHGT